MWQSSAAAYPLEVRMTAEEKMPVIRVQVGRIYKSAVRARAKISMIENPQAWNAIDSVVAQLEGISPFLAPYSPEEIAAIER